MMVVSKMSGQVSTNTPSPVFQIKHIFFFTKKRFFAKIPVDYIIKLLPMPLVMDLARLKIITYRTAPYKQLVQLLYINSYRDRPARLDRPESTVSLESPWFVHTSIQVFNFLNL